MSCATESNLRLALLLLVLLLLTSPAAAQRGAITRPQNLAELVEEAEVIVRGEVLSAHVEAYPEFRNLWTVLVTLRVHETLKGSAPSTYTFRQFIWDAGDRLEAAGYHKGQKLLLMLIAPNALGLSSPAGLEQGRFRIVRDAEGRETAVNGHSNAGLLHELSKHAARRGLVLSAQQEKLAAEHRSGPVPLQELRALIRQFVRP